MKSVGLYGNYIGVYWSYYIRKMYAGISPVTPVRTTVTDRWYCNTYHAYVTHSVDLHFFTFLQVSRVLQQPYDLLIFLESSGLPSSCLCVLLNIFHEDINARDLYWTRNEIHSFVPISYTLSIKWCSLIKYGKKYFLFYEFICLNF